jgi:hypothetical protein
MEENEIRSQKLLKLEMRKPYQTVTFVYKALDIAEDQIKELLEENKKLKEGKDA